MLTAEARDQQPWYRQLTRYHWLVLVLSSAGWLLDCMDQQLFGLARRPAVMELLHARPDDAAMAGTVTEYAGYATMFFMIGWALGGLVFGILGDRVGRVRTMVVSILFYSVFTGMSVFSTSVWDFSAYRLLTGLGVGGQFRRRCAGGGSIASQCPAFCAGSAAIVLGGGEYYRGAGRDRAREFAAGARDRKFLAGDVRYRRAAGVSGVRHHAPTGGARGVEEGEGRGRGAQSEARFGGGVIYGSTLAAECDRRVHAGICRRRGFVGHRIFQL